MTQCELVLNYIEEHGSITARQAYKLGIMRLASRSRDGSVTYVSRYSMRKKDEQHE